MSIRPLASDTSNLIIDAPSSNLKAVAYSGSGTISVYSISGFAVNQVLLIGEPGQEESEIIKTHSSTAPSGNTVTLASNLTKTHAGDTKVYSILFNQIEFSHSSTTTGARVVMDTISIDPENTSTIINDSTYTGGYYFTRYYNSISNTFSEYSDAIPYKGFSSNTVSYIIDLAMKETGKDYTPRLTYNGLVQEINECLRFIRGKLKRWSNDYVYDYVFGQANRGVWSFPLPTNYYDPNSNRSMLDVRIGTLQHLIYLDKQEFDDLMYTVNHSTIVSQASVGDTSITITSSADFNATGTLDVYINNNLINVSYTANDTSTGILSGIPVSGDGSITSIIPSTTDIWQGEFENTPTYFTVHQGYLYIWPLADATNTQKNIYGDYATSIIEVNSDQDEIPLARFDMVKHWLMWTIRNITERNGKKDMNDGDFALFNGILNDAIRRDASGGNKFKMKPKVSGMKYDKYINPNESYDSYQRS